MIFYRRYDEQITKHVDSNYESFLNRFKQKKEIKIKNAKIKLIDFQLFRALEFLYDETKYLLDMLIYYANTYQIGYFNNKYIFCNNQGN
jgi:hypothetical protein